MSNSSPLRVIVTAAARGIGRVTAAAFLDLGARVWICDADEPAVLEFGSTYPAAKAKRCDVIEESEVQRFVAAAVADMGGIDVLVNNAGIAGPTALIEDVRYDDWRRCLSVNIDSQFLFIREVAPIMKFQGSGSIINFSSTAGLYGYGHRTPYAAAKWAVIGLTKSVAIELGPQGIRVNAICPGSVDGERMDQVIASQAKATGMSPEAVRADYASQSSLRRFVDPQEIADTVLFLASPQASMISGQALTVDGHTETFR
ncbi:NAD(P)-dependent dehydrogenase (short-subunit alcohol dehydrogenase family) [Rhodoligotrophos appendicifer]|uniref:SDR family oxidoreductase n=1 Tax=Rhodoligotrophos appendicifer TaxID=987056 RepID=UPI0011850631|nr:SDR family oxidoreductase [Rhodoligotrophos appendicifer]